MRKALATILTLLILGAFGQGQTAASYIGYEYKGVVPDTVMPNGVKHLGGALISDINKDPVHGIAQVSKGRTQMLWLEVSTGQNEKGVTGWRVLDVISFPKTAGSQHAMLPLDPAVECTRNGKTVPNLVAIGRIDTRRASYTVQRAWIADIDKKKFTPASIRGLRCIYSEP
jgi:hypothetical protein